MAITTTLYYPADVLPGPLKALVLKPVSPKKHRYGNGRRRQASLPLFRPNGYCMDIY
jgi:hypothetical protein